MSFKKKTILLVLSLFIVSIFTGCSNTQTQGKTAKYIRYSVGAEPETIDPRKSTGIPEANIQAQIFEGLTSLDSKDNPIPATAEKWTISPDGLKYTFFIRPTAKWSNGEPVTAYDFEYAWKSALSPELGSKYAYQLYYLKNGEAYNKKHAKAEDVGVKAVNDRTLEVTLEQPTAYFLSLTAFHTLYPVHKKTVENNNKWATDPKTTIGNGPFKMISWVHNSKIEFAKNENYWDAGKVKMNKLDFILTDSNTTELAMFENGQIDMGDNAPTAEFPRLKKENKLKIFPYLGTYYYCFNVTKPPFDNPKVRKAFTMAIDRESLIKNVTKGEQKVALAWIPYGLPDAKTSEDFRNVGGSYFKDKDFETAKKLLADAGYPDGQGLPTITLVYNTNDMHKAVAEAVQEMWKKNLGVNINLTNQEWKVFLNTRRNGDYQVARHGWIGDYADPMTFADVFVSGGGNNDAQYKNPEYDKLIKIAKSTNDQTIRMKAMHDAEKILFEDAVIAPIYFYTRPVIVKPNIKGYVRSVLGHVYFKEAYVE